MPGNIERAGEPSPIPGSTGIMRVFDLADVGLKLLRQKYVGQSAPQTPYQIDDRDNGPGPRKESAYQGPAAEFPVYRDSEPISEPIDMSHIFRTEERAPQRQDLPVPSITELAASLYATDAGLRGKASKWVEALRAHTPYNHRRRIVGGVIAGIATVSAIAAGAALFPDNSNVKADGIVAAPFPEGAKPTAAAKPSVGPATTAPPINLETTLTAGNILGKTPISIVGMNMSGTTKVVYPDLKGKTHEITTSNGKQLSWSIAQAFEYYGVQADAKSKLFSVSKDGDVTVITVDLKNYDVTVDPTFEPGHINDDKTEDQFAMTLFDDVPVSPTNLNPSVYILLGALTTKLPTKLDETKYVSPQAWLKLGENDRMVTAAKPITILALETKMLKNIEDPKGPCGTGGMEEMQRGLTESIKKNITDVLTRKGQDMSAYRIEVVGALQPHALMRLQNSSFGKMFKSALQAQDKFLVLSPSQAVCKALAISK